MTLVIPNIEKRSFPLWWATDKTTFTKLPIFKAAYSSFNLYAYCGQFSLESRKKLIKMLICSKTFEDLNVHCKVPVLHFTYQTRPDAVFSSAVIYSNKSASFFDKKNPNRRRFFAVLK